MMTELNWQHEDAPGWDGTGTVAESWYATIDAGRDDMSLTEDEYLASRDTPKGVCVARIDRFDRDGAYAYTVTLDGDSLPGAESMAAESFEAAEAAVLAIVDR